MIGKTVSHYRILEKLGEGGMGVVYRAEDTKLGREVALKFLSSEGAGSSQDRARFLREARAAAALDHRNICPVYEIGEAEGQAFIAMAFVDGESLRRRIETGASDLSEIVEIVAQVADGLSAAHEKGVVHRDIKPENIMVTGGCGVRITDFGLAKLAAATRLTRPGSILGTIPYMSPEQASREDVDHRSDIWSLGVILYEMVTGERPFTGAHGPEIMYSILNDKPRLLTSLRPDAPDELEDLVERCLAKEADERIQSAVELASALRRIGLADPDRTKAAGVSADEVTAAVSVRRPSDLPCEIAGYKIHQRLGEGGMGMVYLAEQEKPVRRRVALKVIKLGMDTKEVIARFESERQALAMMNHPNIARIFEAGSTEEGRPYFAMEYVPGESVTEYCDKHRLSIRERLDLFMQVCRGIHHAHQKGIIHRDIKPSNILVMLQDDTPTPKVIDFGVAKATTQHLTERTVFTEFGELVGTPEYMSPEQLEMTGLDVDTTTDVYSLGVLLYELLVGALPFEPKTLREAGWDGLRQLIREVDPPRPSTRIAEAEERAAEAAGRRQTEAEALRKSVSGELDWITMRALEKDRTRRYQSASEFAADVERYMNDEPVQASPPSTAYRFGKFVRRHRVPVAAAAAIALTILVLGSVAIWQGRIAQERAAHVRANGILASAAATEDPLLKALLVLELADFPDLPGRLSIAREAANHPLPIAAIKAHDTGIWAIAFDPDGSRFATGSRGGLLKIWRSDGTGEPIVLRGHEWGIWDMSFTTDGTRIITASEDGTARIWRTDGLGEPVVLRGHTNRILCLAVSPDDRLVATASGDSTARIWRTDGQGEPIILEHGSWVSSVDFHPDGTRVATASRDGLVRIWSLDNLGEPLVLRGHDSRVWHADFSPDGTLIASASDDGTARIWPSDGGGDPVILEHEGSIYGAAFGPDGSWVSTGDVKGVVRIWPADGRGDPTVLSGHKDWLNGMNTSPDGTRIVTAGHDGTVRIWRTDGAAEPVVLCRQDAEVMKAVFSPDGSLVVTASGDGSIRIWQADEAGEPTELKGDCVLWDCAFSPDGSRVVGCGRDGLIRVWAADGSGQSLTVGRHEAPATSVGFNPDGSLIVSGSRDSTARIWRADGGGDVAVLREHDGRVVARDFSPDGTLVASASSDGKLIVWPTDMSSEPVVVADLNIEISTPIFTPDGEHIIAAADDGKVRMWQADGKGEASILAEHKGLWGTALSNDGHLLATTSFVDNTARIWTIGTTNPPITLRGHSNEVYSAGFSPPADYVATSSIDNTVRVWDVNTGSEVLCLRGDGEITGSAVFSPDGTRLVVCYSNGARILRVTWEELKDYLRGKARGCLTPEQRLRFLGETPNEAWAAYAECERRWGRTPAIEKPE
ncbi:MAG: protein kinase [Candidatus Eisenbacteria sp.]|nr:protein kinase [Candidatus Eisenbacteria bacterium]